MHTQMICPYRKLYRLYRIAIYERDIKRNSRLYFERGWKTYVKIFCFISSNIDFDAM